MKIFDWKYFLSHNAFIWIHNAVFFFATYYSQANIMSTHPRRVLYAYSFIYICVTHRMQYTHVTMERFNPFRRTVLLTWGLMLLQTVLTLKTGQGLMDEPTLYLVLAVISFCSMTHLIWYVIDELKEILNINAFIITRPLREKSTKTN